MVKRELDGQDGQEDLYRVRRVKDPQTGKSYLAVDVEVLIRRAEAEDSYEGVYGNSPIADLGSVRTSRGRSTSPRIPQGDSS